MKFLKYLFVVMMISCICLTSVRADVTIGSGPGGGYNAGGNWTSFYNNPYGISYPYRGYKIRLVYYDGSDPSGVRGESAWQEITSFDVVVNDVLRNQSDPPWQHHCGKQNGKEYIFFARPVSGKRICHGDRSRNTDDHIAHNDDHRVFKQQRHFDLKKNFFIIDQTDRIGPHGRIHEDERRFRLHRADEHPEKRDDQDAGKNERNRKTNDIPDQLSCLFCAHQRKGTFLLVFSYQHFTPRNTQICSSHGKRPP